MYQLDYGYLKFMQQEKLREAEQQRKVAELLQEARTGRLSEIVRSWQRADQQKQETTDVRPVPAL